MLFVICSRRVSTKSLFHTLLIAWGSHEEADGSHGEAGVSHGKADEWPSIYADEWPNGCKSVRL